MSNSLRTDKHQPIELNLLTNIGVFLFFLGMAFMIGRFSLASPLKGDDLHLIRTYSSNEMAEVWRNTWDPDKIETPGFRPLTTYFYHVQAILFGSSVLLFRVFLLGLYSFLLTIVGIGFRNLLQTSYAVILFGGTLSLFHTANVSNYAWISDGTHLLSGILIAGALYCSVKFIHTGNAKWLLVSLLQVVLALLIREDSLIVYPLLILFIITALLQSQKQPKELLTRIHHLVLFACTLVVIFFGWFYYRSDVVPQATPLGINFKGFVWSLLQTVQILGDSTRLVVWQTNFLLFGSLWLICLGFMATVSLLLLDRKTLTHSAVWIAAMTFAALPGLTLARNNLLLFPTIFFGFYVATTLVAISKKSATGYICAVVIAFFALSASAYGSSLIQREQTTSNLDYICNSAEWIYGKFAHATIPEERRGSITKQLSELHINSMNDIDMQLPILVEQAELNNRYAPSTDGLPFIPRFRFIISPNWKPWSCVGRQGWLFSDSGK
ncbi:MAG: hypothetical protein KF753_24655 [Caldilineaceae bacterium]|nr:hypothetical protein [Caldilineaceae bacterium]